MGVTLGTVGDNGPGGWTTFTASVDTNIIYCSNSTGDDTWDGSQPVHTSGIHGPVKTLIKALGGSGPGISTATGGGNGTGLGTLGAGNSFALRSGNADWVLLKEGDTWTGETLETGLFDEFNKRGRSQTEPLLISSYDPSQPGVAHPGVAPRPLIKVPHDRDGLHIVGGGTNPIAGGSYLAVVGLRLYSYQRDSVNNPGDFVSIADSTIGIFTLNNIEWQLIEDCEISFFGGAAADYSFGNNILKFVGNLANAGWTTLGSGWSFADPTITATSASSDISQTVASLDSTQNGQAFAVTYTLTVTAGSVNASVGGTAGPSHSTSGTYTDNIVSGGSNVFKFTGSGFSGTITAVSSLAPTLPNIGLFYDWNRGGSGWSSAIVLAPSPGFGIVMTITGASATGDLTQQVTGVYPSELIIPGKKYRITYILDTISGGSVTPKIGGTAGVTRTTPGVFAEDIVCGAGTSIVFTGSSFTGTITETWLIPYYGGQAILRRNSFHDTPLSTVGINIGISAYGLTGILGPNTFEENIWLRCGKHSSRCRNLYLGYTSANVVFKQNISAYSGSEGVQFRTGAVIKDNLFVRNPTGFDIGHNEGIATNLSSEASGNCVWECNDATDLGDEAPLGIGFEFLNSRGSGVSAHDNIVAHRYPGFNNINSVAIATDPFGANGGITFDASVTAPFPTFDVPGAQGSDGTHGVLIQNNIVYDWPSYLNDLGSVDGHGAANIVSNPEVDLTGANVTPITRLGGALYPRPGTNTNDGTNSVGSYYQSIGHTLSTDDFLNARAVQSKFNWDPTLTTNAVTTYLKAGFGVGSSPPPVAFHSWNKFL